MSFYEKKYFKVETVIVTACGTIGIAVSRLRSTSLNSVTRPSDRNIYQHNDESLN